MALDLGGTKKKQDVKTQYSIIEIDLFKPTRKKYPEIDYEELRRNQLREGESSGEDERFHDREAMEMVRRLEAKYGNKKTKKGKKIHFGTEDDFIDKGAGYDLEDAFIDDSEAYDELIPSTLDTVRGGFYVNKGKLEFKSRVDEADESDISEDNADDVRKSSKGKKRIMVESDEEAMEEGESAAPEPQTSKASENVAATVESVPKNVPTSPIRRMAGAPPTKKFASAPMGSSPAQRAAQAIKKKRLGGLPPMLNKAKLLKKATKPPSVSVPGVVSATSTNGDVAIQKAVVPSTTMVAPSPEKSNSAPSVVPSISPSVSVVDNTSAAAPKLTSSTSENDVGPNLSASSSDVILSSPTKKTLPPLTDTLSTLLSDFKTKTAGLATPGLKKRLQNHHVDMVIRIEDQCLKDGFSNHEKSRVLHSLADYCGIQKNSLHVRIQKRKDELKQPSVQPGTSSAPMPSPMKQASVASSTNSDIQVLENTSVFKKDAMKKVASSSTATAKTSTDLTQQQQQFQDATNMIANLMKSPGVTEQDIVKLATVAKSKDGNRDFMRTYQEIMLSAAKKVAQGAGTASAKSNPTTPSANSQPTPQKSSSLTVKSAMNTTAASPKAATSAPKMSLSQVIEKQAPVARSSHAASVSKNIHEIKRLLDAATESVQKAITTALSSGERIYQDKCTRNAAAGKAPPTFVFLWTEFLLASLDKLLDVAYQAVYCTQPNCTSTAVSENIYSYIKTNILPLFRGRVRIGQLLVEICRRYPERSLILAHPSLKKDLADEGIDLQKVSISSKKSVDVVKTKKSINMPSRPSSKNGTDADIQVLEGDGTLPSTSFASTNGTTSTNGVRSKASGNAGTPSTSSSTSVTAADPLAGITPQDLANIQQSVQQLTAMGATPDQIATVKQTMLLGAMQNAQANMLLKSQQQSSFAAKEARKKEKEEEKMRQIAQRKAEMAAQKQKLLEEKKKKIEEEKRQKAAEKAQKLEEERLRRLKEQEERERRIQEENDRKIREEQERKRIEEEKLRKIQEMKVKVEQQEAREKEQQRLAQMREEEENAALLLQEEIALDSEENIPVEVLSAREDARKQEEERVRLQQEKAAAARVAALSASETKPLQKSAAPTVPPPVATEAKPLAHNSGSTSNMSSYSAGFASPQNTFHSPHNNTLMNGQSPMQVPSSPQYGNGFAYPGSHGSGSIGQSPQQQLTPMTPPMHRSPFQQQQMQQQSPYSTGAVQSPVAAARTAPVMAGMSPQTHLMPQQQQQLQMNGNSGHYPSVHQQHQQHANMNGSSGMPGQFVPTAMNGSPAAQSYPQQQQQQYYQQQNQQQQQVQHQHVLNQQQQCQQTQMAAVQQQQQQQRMQQQQMYQQQQQQAMAERQLQERYRQQQMFNQQQSYQQHNQNNGF